MVYSHSLLVLLTICLAHGITMYKISGGSATDLDQVQAVQTNIRLKRHVAAVQSVVEAVTSMLTSPRSRTVRATADAYAKYEKMKIKAECDIFGKSEAYTKYEETLAEVIPCIQRVTIDALMERLTLDPNELVKQLCSKSADLNRCYSPTAEALLPCITPEERPSAKKFVASTYDFLCENNRLGLFITDGGASCFVEKNDELEQCVQTAYPAVRHENDVTSSSLVARVCKSRALLRQCVKQQLEKCDRPTALNFFNDMVQKEGSAWSCLFLNQ